MRMNPARAWHMLGVHRWSRYCGGDWGLAAKGHVVYLGVHEKLLNQTV